MGAIVKPGIVLFIVSVVAAVCLGYVYDITKAPIAEQAAQAKAQAMTEILAVADEFTEVEEDDVKIKSVNKGLKGGEAVGYVIAISPKGYAGDVDLLVGVDMEGVITGIKIVKHSETPGLGANATKESFTSQYIGKSGKLNVIKTGPAGESDIEAITSATITTTAVTTGVNDALQFFAENLK